MFRFIPTACLSPRALYGMAAVAAGAGLLGAAAPAAVASLMETAAAPAMERLREERAVDAPALRGLVRSREAAARWRGAARTHTEMALGRLLLAEYGAAARRGENLALAESALARGLELAPMDPYGWMRLVQVRMLREAPAADIAPALRLALRSGPHEDLRHAMRLLMLESGLRAWDDLEGAERRLIADKAREAWRRDARGAAAAAVRAGETELLAGLLGF